MNERLVETKMKLTRILTGRLRAAALSAALLLLTPLPLAAHPVPLDAEGMVRGARQIVVAVITGKTVRWNEGHRLIVTDYQLVVEDQVKGNVPRSVTLRMPGGTLDGIEDGSCASVPLEVGSRYLLFLEDVEEPMVSPLAGGAAGAMREEVRDGVSRVRVAARPDAVSDADGKPVAFRDFVERMKSFVADVESRTDLRRAPLTERTDLPRKISDLAGAAHHARAFENAGRVMPALAGNGLAPLAPANHVFEQTDDQVGPTLVQTGTPATVDPVAKRGISPLSYYQNAPNRFITFNQLPAGATPWAPRDQQMMSEWNRIGDIFRVAANPTGNWAFGNGVFDITGFPSSADMLAQFGARWGATELAICYTRVSSGRIIEADVSVNPAVAWTFDLDVATRPSTVNSTWGFDQTMLHELGHAWGLRHPWETQNVWWDSVMNYAPKEYRFPVLTTDDANAIRAAYPGITLHDGTLSTYSTSDNPTSSQARYTGVTLSPNAVNPEDSFQLSGSIKLENIGTDSIVNPAIEVYLTPVRMSWTNAVYLRTASFGLTIPTYARQMLSLGSTTVPASVAPGRYYLGLYLRDNADPTTNNNAAWTNDGEQLQVFQHSPVSISPSTSWRTVTGSIGPEGLYRFSFPTLAGARYDLSLCTTDGGSGSFNTELYAWDSVTLTRVENDNACGGLSRISGWTPPAGATAVVGVEGNSAASYGSFRLAYRRSCSAIEVAPATLPDGAPGTEYSQSVFASGSVAPYSYTISGTLPPGLTFNPASGILSGTPTEAGSFTFTITATDSGSCSGSRTYTLTIGSGCPSISVEPASLEAPAYGVEYSQSLYASGGEAPHTFAVVDGALPEGLTLGSDGLLSGTPAATGTFVFTVAATDANGCSGGLTYTLTIADVCPTIWVEPSSLDDATYGIEYSHPLSASGGSDPYTFAVVDGALPGGLQLGSDGVISGTPVELGSYTFTVDATDANGCAGSVAIMMTVME